MNVNQERIAKLQQEMQLAGIDVYLVPTADFHQSEYVGDYFKARAWLSGFTGSAGTLIVTKMRPAFGQTADTLSRLESSLPAQG